MNHPDWASLDSVALIGTYLPRRCGIATFTSDLTEAIAGVSPDTKCQALAVNDRAEGYQYPNRVKFELGQNRVEDYRTAAEYLRINQCRVVCLQHEYGIFGPADSDDGRYVLELLQRLRVPLVTTLHTVLDQPTSSQREIFTKIAEYSDRLVVMAERAVQILTDVYGVPLDKVVHIPHGIPDAPFVDPSYYKDQFGVEGKKVILTFGLLSPGKGIETMIDALPMVTHAHPNVVYIVLGATHPHVQLTYGEDYRKGLLQRAKEKSVDGHVIFHDRFIDLHELREFLSVADVYVTPYHRETQICSGTLAYALGTGNAVVSTPYWYAQEMLGDDRGRLVPFRDPQALANTIIDLFNHDLERHAMRKRAYMFTRDMIWPEVARRYLDLFVEVQDQRQRAPRPLFDRQRRVKQAKTWPNVQLKHVQTMTDGTGILQHARFAVPNRAYGYCTDDNARALMVVLKSRAHVANPSECDALASCYLSFLNHAYNRGTGRFHNFMNFERSWIEQEGSEDSHGRAIWALGTTIAHSEIRGHRTLATALFQEALPAMRRFKFVRSWVYGLLGIHEYLNRFAGDTEVSRLREELSGRLLEKFERNATDNWPWPEPCLTYANARLPHALLVSGPPLGNQNMVDMALRALEWLVEIQTTKDGHFSAVGNMGWYPKDGTKAKFDQQPLEAAAVCEACLVAADVSEDEGWVDQARRSLDWFLGQNELGVTLIDVTTGGCCDGLKSCGPNENQGAESTLVWLLALLAMKDRLEMEPASMAIVQRTVRRGQATSPTKTSILSDEPTDQTVVSPSV